MAEAIVSIALERLAAITEDKIREEIGLVRGVKKEVHYLSSKFIVIRNVLEDAEKRRFQDKNIQNWLKKLEDISYDVDDVLDEWNYAILKLQIEGSKNYVVHRPKVCSFIPCSCLCIKKVATRHDIAVKIKELKERLDVIVEEKDLYDFVIGQVIDSRKFDRVRSTSSLDVKEIQGREVEKDVLVNKLILEGACQESGPNVISIVGTGGIGKTTVAQLVYNDERVINYFKLRIWICVSDVFDEARIAKGIVESVKGSSPNVHELDALLKCVTNSISGEMFLLVLDDVWTEDYNKLEPLKNSLKCGGPGSKILVTTRSERVARMMGTIELYPLGQLSNAECWSLKKRVAFSGWRGEKRDELYDIGKNIAKKCKGLPLAAKVLGSLLRFKDTVEEWENVLNSEIWQLETAEVDLFPHLLLSYNELPSAMKHCFSYCAIFPKDSKIDVKKLIRMWMAFGYLGSDGSPSDLELRGKEYFDNLRMRSFFQDFEEWHDQMTCKMHDIVHDFAQFLTKGRSHDSEDRDGKVEERGKRSCQALDSSLISQIKGNRTFFFPKELPSDLLDSVTCLRVLSLCGCGLKEISGNIANLIHLRYLDLSANQWIPQVLQTMCKLYNLQTLCLNQCQLEEIPREIGNLIQLRYLDLSSNRFKEIPREIGDLIQLRHLDLSWNRFNEIPREIGNLIQLRHLDCSNSFIKELPETIYKLHNLRSLDLTSCSLSSLPEGIDRLKNLRHLHNFCTSINRIPQGLETLTGLQTLREFVARRDGSKLGYLKKLDQLSGTMELIIYLHGQEDVEEAKKAALKNKKHIKYMEIKFLDRMSESDGEKLVENEAMEALQPPPNLQLLNIRGYQGTKFPNWMTSSLNHLKVLAILGSNYCSTLPPLGKLPCLEELSVQGLEGFKFLNREFLGISGDTDGSTPSSAVVVGFPKLKKLWFELCLEWKEWEDITAEQEMNSSLSIMPSLRDLDIHHCELTTLPHLLLRKASALEYLRITGSWRLLERYEDKNGSGWRFLSHIPHVKVEYI